MSRFRGGFLVAAAVFGAAVSAARADDVCPGVTLDPKASKTVSYPGGEPGRRPQDYSYIAVILSADAVCTTDDDDNVIAQVNVTYAVEAGTLYRGAGEVTVEAAVRGSATAGGGNATKKVTPPAEGGSITVTDTIANVVAGNEDAVEQGLVTIVVGFAKAQ